MECVYTNDCFIEDDFRWLSERLLKADALVVGSPSYYGSVSAFTKAFMERMYAFRHLTSDERKAGRGGGGGFCR